MNSKLIAELAVASTLFTMGLTLRRHNRKKLERMKAQQEFNKTIDHIKDYLFEQQAILQTQEILNVRLEAGEFQGWTKPELQALFEQELEFQKIAVRNEK